MPVLRRLCVSLPLRGKFCSSDSAAGLWACLAVHSVNRACSVLTYHSLRRVYLRHENQTGNRRRRDTDAVEFRTSNNVVRLPAELGLEAEFEVSSSLGTAEWKDAGRQYDAVTCMFALHYFFASERSLKQMLHNVSINLKPGSPLACSTPFGSQRWQKTTLCIPLSMHVHVCTCGPPEHSTIITASIVSKVSSSSYQIALCPQPMHWNPADIDAAGNHAHADSLCGGGGCSVYRVKPTSLRHPK